MMDKDRQINKIEKIIENYNEITGLTDGWMDGWNHATAIL